MVFRAKRASAFQLDWVKPPPVCVIATGDLSGQHLANPLIDREERISWTLKALTQRLYELRQKD
jgi:hypothetical protein